MNAWTPKEKEANGMNWLMGIDAYKLSITGTKQKTNVNLLYSTGRRACSVASNSLQAHALWPARLLCPWGFPGKNTGVGGHFLLQGIFLTLGLNPCFPCLLLWQEDSSPVSHLGTPMLCSDLTGKEIQKVTDKCICIADVLGRRVETNTTL